MVTTRVGEVDAQPEGPGLRAGRASVLVVDDEPDMLENLTRILRRGSYLCLTAPNAEAALGAVETQRPDLVITDLRMPGMDGFSLLRALQRRSPGLPVVIFSASASDDTVRDATEAGAAAFLPKPFSSLHLLQTIRETLRVSGGQPASA
jgi:DNA-binding NtrC family response regulator